MLEVDHGRLNITQAQSAFMARQAERAHLTGLSPIEEMRIAQNELRAKAAKQIVRALPSPLVGIRMPNDACIDGGCCLT